MKDLKINTNPEFEKKIAAYPDFVRDKLQYLRELIIETAREVPEITELEETLKWGEPSFLTKTGSTLRIDWKKRLPANIKFILNVQPDWSGLLNYYLEKYLNMKKTEQ